jgi:hypothetical protein
MAHLFRQIFWKSECSKLMLVHQPLNMLAQLFTGDVLMSMHEKLLQAIQVVTPPGAEIKTKNGIDGIGFSVSWLLGDDPERPNKRSKTIVISVSHEAAQDYETAPNSADAGARLQRILAENFANFDPNHDTAKYEPPPVERWVIRSDMLFG